MTIPNVPNPGVRINANQGAAFLAALTGYATGLNVYNYGASYSTLNQAFHTAGDHWTQLLAEELGLGTVTSYGINGRRAIDVASALLNAAGGLVGVTTPVSGATWPGVSARPGVIIHDALGNDFFNEADQSDATLTPAAVTAGSTYVNYLKQTWRAHFALMSSETRIENHSHSTTSGVWTHSSAATWPSGGTTCFTTANAAYAEYSVTPAQSGPLAGKVWVILGADIASPTNYAAVNYSVDGGGTTAWTQHRSTYISQGGSTVRATIQAIPITLPVDGAAHTIRITHNGSAGEYLVIDCVLVPSVTPNPILCMGVEHDFNVVAGGIDAAGLAVWKRNVQILTPEIKAICAEFSNVIYVPSTMTTEGLWTGDGIHPNDKGMRQRAGDAAGALRAILPRLRSRAIALEPNSSFGVI